MSEGPYYTWLSAARAIGVCDMTVIRYAAKLDIEPTRIGGRCILSAAQFERIRAFADERKATLAHAS